MHSKFLGANGMTHRARAQFEQEVTEETEVRKIVQLLSSVVSVSSCSIAFHLLGLKASIDAFEIFRGERHNASCPCSG